MRSFSSLITDISNCRIDQHMFSTLIFTIQFELKLDACLIFFGSIHYTCIYCIQHPILIHVKCTIFQLINRGHCGRDHTVVGFTTTCAVKETTARQKREENKFGKYVCVRTRQSGDRTSWGEFWLFCTRPCQPAWRSGFSVNDSVKFLIQQ